MPECRRITEDEIALEKQKALIRQIHQMGGEVLMSSHVLKYIYPRGNKYDAIVDFMIYTSESEFEAYYKLFLENTNHYIFLSTYRVYANTVPITEESPRLLDVSADEAFLASGDYAIYKAQEEEILKESDYTNWTIIRPAITYSKKRFQLTTLEANVLITRMWEVNKRMDDFFMRAQ